MSTLHEEYKELASQKIKVPGLKYSRNITTFHNRPASILYKSFHDPRAQAKLQSKIVSPSPKLIRSHTIAISAQPKDAAENSSARLVNIKTAIADTRPRAYTVLAKRSMFRQRLRSKPKLRPIQFDKSLFSVKKTGMTVSGNSFVSLCGESRENTTSHKLFNKALPDMLDKRFKQILGPVKKVNNPVLHMSSLHQMIVSAAASETLATRIIAVVEKNYRKLTKDEFLSLLLDRLASGQRQDQLRFCYQILDSHDKDSLNYITLHSWLQSDAEPLLRNDLLAICSAFKRPKHPKIIYSRATQAATDTTKFSEFALPKSALGDLGLWGHACQKVRHQTAPSRNRLQYHTIQTLNHPETADKICEDFRHFH